VIYRHLGADGDPTGRVESSKGNHRLARCASEPSKSLRRRGRIRTLGTVTGYRSCAPAVFPKAVLARARGVAAEGLKVPRRRALREM
jgi:hypothetical protein